MLLNKLRQKQSSNFFFGFIQGNFLADTLGGLTKRLDETAAKRNAQVEFARFFFGFSQDNALNQHLRRTKARIRRSHRKAKRPTRTLTQTNET